MRPDGNIRHSQVLSTFGPGALADLVDDAAIVAGLSWWAKGPAIQEDRLLAMLARQEGFEKIQLFAPPPGGDQIDEQNRKWIKAFRFPEWFSCQNEDCWADAGMTPRRDGSRPRRLLHTRQLDGTGHKCKGGKGKTSKVQPVLFTRACRFGHIDDIEWISFLHRKRPDCKRPQLWIDEASASGDLNDMRVACSSCGEQLRMSVAAAPFSEGEPPLGYCEGKRLWLGETQGKGCGERMRFLLRSASHAYFPVPASVIHIPDQEGAQREKIGTVFETLKNVESIEELKTLRKLVSAVTRSLDGISNEAAFAEVVRRREGKPVQHKKVKEAELEVFLNLPPALATDRPEGRFYARTLTLPATRSKLMEPIERVVLVHRLSEVRTIAGFTRFAAQTTDKDGELDIGVEVARLDEPLTWLPTVEHPGEGFFFALKDEALKKWEEQAKVQERAELFRQGFKLWQAQREERERAKPDFAAARFVLLHSLSHLLITAVSLDCGYSSSSIRERIYCGSAGCGILLYTSSPGAEGSLGGLVEVGRRLERYLQHAVDLGRLCANDPVCAVHEPAHDTNGSDRYLEGASCHGCLLISEPSCERMNMYLDRTLVVPTVEQAEAAFFKL
jgi:hypothetical protein